METLPFFSFITQMPRCVFELFFALMLCGILLALYCRWGKPCRKRFFIFAAGLIFMSFWRSFFELLSSRYSSIFIYPAIGFTIYFCYAFVPAAALTIRKKFPRFARNLLAYRKVIGRTAIALIMLGCLLKLARYNRFDRVIPNAAAAAKNDPYARKNVRMIIDYTGVGRRYNYYARIYVKQFVRKKEIPLAQQVKKELEKSRCVLYIFINEKRDAVLTAGELGIRERQWKRIFSEPRSNSRKMHISVYRYIPEKLIK